MSKATDYRNRSKRKSALTAPLELPSGETFIVRRLPLQTWLAAGKIPQSFLRMMLEADSKEAAAATMTTDETLASVEFMRDAVLYVVVEPPLRIGAKEGDADGALDPAELEPEDFEFLTQQIMQGMPCVPVETEGGATSVKSLSSFRQKRPGGGFVGDSVDGDEVRTEAVATAQAA